MLTKRESLETEIERLVERISENLPGEQLSDRAVQQLFTVAIKLYADRLERIDSGEVSKPAPPPFDRHAGLTPTDIVRTVNQMLAAADVELFELGLWQTWGRL